MQLKSFLQNEIVDFLYLLLMVNLSTITLIFISFFYTYSSGFFFQFETCMIYCFHDQFFILFRTYRLYLIHQEFIEVKVNIYLFFFKNNYYFSIELMHVILFC